MVSYRKRSEWSISTVPLPLFTTHGKTLALDALRTGMNVAEDVLCGGRGLKESVRKRVPEGIKRTAQNLISQSGSGDERRRIVPKKKKRKCHRYSDDTFKKDIFG